MQRVEEKVRMNLHFQGFQLRLDKLRAEFRSLQLTFTIVVVVVVGMTHEQDCPVNEEPAVEVPVNKTEDSEWCNLRGSTPKHHQQDVVNNKKSADDQETEEKLEQEPLQPIVTLYAITLRQPKHERRSNRPEVTSQPLQDKVAQGWLRLH